MFYDNEKSSKKLKIHETQINSNCESVLTLQPWYERGPGHKPECFCDKLELSQGRREAVDVALDGPAVVVAVALDHPLLTFCSEHIYFLGDYCFWLQPHHPLSSLVGHF